MSDEAVGTRWIEELAGVVREIQGWRGAHARASFSEIEAVIDARLNRVRARLVAETALASPATRLAAGEASEPQCPTCGQPLQRRGTQTRQVIVQGDETVTLKRGYAVCVNCGTGHFPPG